MVILKLIVKMNKLLLKGVGLYFLFIAIACQGDRHFTKIKTANREQQGLEDFIREGQLTIMKERPGIAVSVKDLACDCHVQGIGWASEERQIVITCQDLCAEKSAAYLLLYQENQLLPLDVEKGATDAFFNHPSAIQISNKIFPVAFASTRNEDSFITFYNLNNQEIKRKNAHPIHIKGRHIGALAYATIQENTYLLGVGWDAEDLTIWRAKGRDKAADFEEIFYSNNSQQFIQKRFWNDWGPYNSLWLGTTKTGKVILVGTHGKKHERNSRLTIWEIEELDGSNPTFKLLSKKKVREKTPLGIPYFHEGVTFKTLGSLQDSVSLLAAPHDFTATNCPQGYRCSNAIYEFKVN